MMQLPDDSGITLMQYSPWVWHVCCAGKHVGTISGDRVGGFTARDIHFESIGRGYASAEAAVEAWAADEGDRLALPGQTSPGAD